MRTQQVEMIDEGFCAQRGRHLHSRCGQVLNRTEVVAFNSVDKTNTNVYPAYMCGEM